MLKKNLPLLFFNKSRCLGVRKGKCPQNAKIWLNLFVFLTQVLPGCDCCEVDGKLVSDGYVWMRGNQTLGEAFKFIANHSLNQIVQNVAEEILFKKLILNL